MRPPTVSTRRLLRGALLLLAVLPGVPAGARAQEDGDLVPGRSVMTRADLTALLERYEEALGSPAYSERLKAEARTNVDRVRDRLENGDFRVGDRVVLEIRGEPDLPDTVMVESGPRIVLPLFGEISLRGVLRSEVQEHLSRELGRLIHEPSVRAQGLMRVSIQGQVQNPGFFVVPTDMLVSEALMLAGGPTGVADLRGLRIERGTRRILGGAELQDAMLQGRTLDQLNLQAGDQIILPQQGSSVLRTVGRYGLVVASILLLGQRVF